MSSLPIWRSTFSPVIRIPRLSTDELEDLVQEKHDSFYITAMGCEDGFARRGLQAVGQAADSRAQCAVASCCPHGVVF